MKRSSPRTFPGKLFLTLLVVCGFTTSLHAQNQFNLNALEPGQLILNIDANETVDVEQDTLNVSMLFSAQGRDRVTLQDEINEALRDARNILSATDNIDYTIQQYNVYPIRDERATRNNIENPVWRAQQGVQLQSMNSEALLVVTARLQEAGLTVSNMNYSLSAEKFEEVADSLMNAALLKLQARAGEAARSLNKGRSELIEVNINSGQNFNGNMAFAMERRVADAAMSVPVAEPGTTQVSLRVEAKALLSQ